MKASELDEKFDNGEDVLDYFDLSKGTRPNLKTKRVNLQLPAKIVSGLDKEAERLGVTREVLINLWITERLSASKPQKKAS
jgi:hypothetical protein